jgi:hypothetical protein
MLIGKLPSDPTRDDSRILNALAVSVYQKIRDPKDKFIMAMIFDLGYPKEDTARALGVTYETVYARVLKIESTLKRHYPRSIKA